MNTLLIIAGSALIATALRDQFYTLFHPVRRAVIGDYLARGVWKLFHRLSQGKTTLLTFAGPVALVAIVASWSLLLVIGCACIYRSQAANFVPAPELAEFNHKSFLDFVNVSLASMITANPDLHPAESWVQTLMNLESFLGLGLVTSSVSWILVIAPALQGRSAAAQQILSLYEAEQKTRISLLDLPEDYVRHVLVDLAAQLNALRNETVQFPIIYYFGVANERGSLPRMLPYLRDLALSASDKQRPPAVQFAGTILQNALHGYIELIRTRFLKSPFRSEEEALSAYLQDNNRVALPKAEAREFGMTY
jgi:hypothetical protein